MSVPKVQARRRYFQSPIQSVVSGPDFSHVLPRRLDKMGGGLGEKGGGDGVDGDKGKAKNERG